MKDQAQLKIVENFIKAHQIAVLATSDQKGMPQAAVVGFSETDNFEIIFGTFLTSRKYQNLKRNSHVALVIGWDQGKTVQLEGVAEEITDQAEIDYCCRVHLAKIPSAVKYVGHADERMFKIKPKWIKYSDWSHDPNDEFEIRF